MIRYAAHLVYVGTKYEGWQSQPSGNTVQDHLEHALKTVLRSEDRIPVIGSSRTDSGVHARMQIATFDTHEKIDEGPVLQSLNALLPSSLRLFDLFEVPMDFHPIASSRGKIYSYTVHVHPVADPFTEAFELWSRRAIDVKKMREVARAFLGTHDFKAFAVTGSTPRSTVRTIYGLEIVELNGKVIFYLHGNGFLKQMVRSIVGFLLNAARNDSVGVEFARKALLSGERQPLIKTAPAQGLCLEYIDFAGDQTLERWMAQRERWSERGKVRELVVDS